MEVGVKMGGSVQTGTLTITPEALNAGNSPLPGRKWPTFPGTHHAAVAPVHKKNPAYSRVKEGGISVDEVKGAI